MKSAIEPFTADAYDFVRLPAQDELCVVTTSDGTWHAHTSITPAILRTMPLLLSSRTVTPSFDIASWSEGALSPSDLQVVSTFDLIANATLLIKTGIANAISLTNLYQLHDAELACIPLDPPVFFSSIVAWKKHHLLSKPCELFLQILQERINSLR